MPRPRPPYLSHERNYRGTWVWYVRIRGKRIRIREAYGTPEFDAAYKLHWPATRPSRKRRVDVLLYTGLRRGDATRLGRQHVRHGTATLTTGKTGTEVSLPILPVLQRTLDARPCGDLAFIVGAKGQPFTKESFGNLFREASREAGVNKSAHGLRKIAATRCAENGATVPQMNAIFGWAGERMALHYIEAANRKKMAADAMHLMNKNRTSIVAPKRDVRQSGQKDE